MTHTFLIQPHPGNFKIFFVSHRDAFGILPDLNDLFYMDRLLKRTYLVLCPVEMYGELLKTGLFSCLELCVTMTKKLLDEKSRSYSEALVSKIAIWLCIKTYILMC